MDLDTVINTISRLKSQTQPLAEQDELDALNIVLIIVIAFQNTLKELKK